MTATNHHLQHNLEDGDAIPRPAARRRSSTTVGHTVHELTNNHAISDDRLANFVLKNSYASALDLSAAKKYESKPLVSVDGFNVICIFHQLVGLPYYGMLPQRCSIFRNFLGISFSLIFVIIFIASLIPCMLICDKEDKMRYKSERLSKSRSAEIIELILMCLEAYHTIDNDVCMIFARKKFQKFYRSLHNMVLSHKLSLNAQLRRKLLRTASILVALNIFYAILECIFLYPVIKAEILHQSDPQDIYIKLHSDFSLYITLIIKAIGSIHSKALDTLIVYISLLITYYIMMFGEALKRLCDTYTDGNMLECVAQSRAQCVSFDDTRLTFLSLQNLIVEANDMLAPCILLTTASNVLAIMGGIFVGIDWFGQKTALAEGEAFDIFNAASCFVSLFACGIFADGVIKETQNALRQLENIRLSKVDERDFKSVKLMIEAIEDSKLRTFNGMGFFTLDKKFLYGISSIVFPFTIILIQKY